MQNSSLGNPIRGKVLGIVSLHCCKDGSSLEDEDIKPHSYVY